MNKKILILPVLCLMFTCLFFVGCKQDVKEKSDQDEKEKAEIVLSDTNIELDLYDRKSINCQVTNSEEKVEWVIDNPEIISLQDGVIIAKKEGEATVTAKIGDVSSHCTVSVRDSGEPLVVNFNETEINLIKGDSFILPVEVVYKDKAFPYADIEVIADNSSILSVDNVTVTALQNGKTSAEIKVSYLGKVLSEYVLQVNIVENYSIYFNTDNNYIELTVAPVDVNHYKDSFPLEITLMKGNVVINNPEFQFSLQDSEICSFEDNVIKALKIGTTLLEVSYTDARITYKTNLQINVVREKVDCNYEYIIKNGDNIDLSKIGLISSDVTKIEDVTFVSKDLFFEVSGENTINVSSESLGKKNILITTDEKTYYCQITFASTVISSKEDFAQYMNQNITPNSENSDYVVVTNDIDMEGAELNHTLWFAGTIDGQGHIIKNFMSWSALRSNSHGAVVKNLGLVYTKKVWVKQYSGVLIAGQNPVDYENVFVDVTYVRDSNPEVDSMAILGDTLTSATKFTNCLIKVRLTGEGCNKIYADYRTKGSDAIFENTYVVSEENILCHEEHKNNGLFVVNSVNDIKNDAINGLFSVNDNGVYYNNKIVLIKGEPQSVYFNKESEIIVPELQDKTVTNVNILGAEGLEFVQVGTKLKFGLNAFARYSTEEKCNVEIITEDNAHFYVVLELSEFDFPKTIIQEKQTLQKNNMNLNINQIGVNEKINHAYIKDYTKDFAFHVDGNSISFTADLASASEYTLVLQSETKQYLIVVEIADFVISTAEEYIDYITNTAENYRNQKYAVLKNDIDLNGATVNSGQYYWADSILDGKGHIVKNFTTSYLFTTGSFWGNHACVLKNIGLEFTFNPAKDGGIYSVDDMDCWDETYTNENVWMNITINRNNFNTALFAAQLGGTSTFKNMVINVNVSGEGEGQLWADYITKKDNSKIENVYVIDNQSVLSKHNDFDETASPSWKDLSVISSVSEIKDLGGMFELKTDGLYFNDKLVKAL